MANINDFKLVKIKSKKMYEYIGIDKTKKLDDISKERLGFYHLILENITGVMEPKENIDKIIDTEYNKLVNNTGVDDLGMDAVYIQDHYSIKGEIDIKLFNFKYRDTFNPDKTKSEKDISRSTKFLEYIVSGKLLSTKKNKLVSSTINKIIKHLNSNNICNITLYMVSNEAKGFEVQSNEYIKILEESFEMKVVNISLDEISSFFNEKKDNHKSSFMISNSEFLSFESDAKSTQKSYILKLSLLDLIRITSEDEKLTNNYSLENDEEIKHARLDFSLLYDNVRGFLGETKYNKNIIDTLKRQHERFFMFNNGITVTTEKIECSRKNSGIKYLFVLENFQIVNGGQTLRSIYNFLNKNCDSENITKLREAYVLLRIFTINKDDKLKNSIAEYTNSQNMISDIDLKSIDSIQIEIEKYFAEMDILYARKAGDLGEKDKIYPLRISMEKLAQILYSSIGYPYRVTNQKKRLFQDYYDEIFNSDGFTLEHCKDLTEKFFEIEKIYKNDKVKYKLSEQKIFYIIYIITFTENSINQSIVKLEVLLKQYNATTTVSQSRKLLQKGFYDYINIELGIYKIITPNVVPYKDIPL